MGLSSTLYGRSQSGMATLKANLDSDCNTMKNTLTGEKYTTLVNAIKACWSGEDADAWLNRLDTKIASIKTTITSLNSQVSSMLDTDYTEFVHQQQNRAQQR